ncbi:MAG: DUF4147 domain-containing protein [Pyrinomonadaceae bacterium]|nr:DUF4147 domain-containing protein [Pyrinomonadaceae bacterium]
MEKTKWKNEINLRTMALDLFSRVFLTIDAEKSVKENVKVENSTLYICYESFQLSDFTEICVVALGKAAIPMAVGLNSILGNKITKGIVSAPKKTTKLPSNWQLFKGGHPVPNRSSLLAARAAIELLKKTNHEKALVIFLISGGGSAMLELPKDEKISLKDLQKTNQVLVNCGAKINEMNIIRRSISEIKGGGLSRIAPQARQISLIISDTNQGDEKSVASGPTFPVNNSRKEALEIAEKYQIKDLLPKSVADFLEKGTETENKFPLIKHTFHTLLDNRTAVESIANILNSSNIIVETVDDLVENPIEEGCRELVKRALKLKSKHKNKLVALISGGEFVCPVRRKGIGGRNLETVLRCLLEFEKQTDEKFDFAVLSGGTDGIDGNSPVAGAVADQTTLERAKKLNLNPIQFLENSDSYNFFRELGDVIVTGATGTNVRDVRILLVN